MESEKYNGWTNYATWRVNLELVDGMMFGKNNGNIFRDIYEVSEYIRNSVDSYLSDSIDTAIPAHAYIKSYIEDYLGGVNWLEIARHQVDGLPELIEQEKA